MSIANEPGWGTSDTFADVELVPEDSGVEVPSEKPVADEVNHPSHYTAGPAEVIDIIEAAVGDPLSYLHGNALKYLLRLRHKHSDGGYGGAEVDTRKAQWYIARMVERMDLEDDQ